MAVISVRETFEKYSENLSRAIEILGCNTFERPSIAYYLLPLVYVITLTIVRVTA